MKSGKRIRLSRRGITAVGVAGILLLIAVFSLPNLLAGRLDKKTAEKWIRQYLVKQAVQRNSDKLIEQGSTVPDFNTSLNWEKEIQQIQKMEFDSLEIKHFLVAPPTSSKRIYMTRVVMRDSEDVIRTRYFSLSAQNRFFDFFWVNEQSAWMWYLSF